MPTRTASTRAAASPARPKATRAAAETASDATPTTRKRTRASSSAAVTSSQAGAEQPPPPPSTPTRGSRSAAKRARTSIAGGARVKVEETAEPIKKEETATPSPRSTNGRRVKKEEEGEEGSPPASPRKPSTAEKKLATYKASIQGSPFPDHPLPTADEAERVAWILGEHHGYKRESEGGRGLPQYTAPKGENKWGGCGDVASVLDATIRTVLSCNTSNRNSSAAHKSLTERFGRQNWQAILDADESEVVDALRCGGLANNKTKTIRGILRETKERHGVLSLDHLHEATDDEIMQELVSFNGVGPKVASCVLAFCIGRQSMAVDTHVFRLCKSLGWVPEKANRDQTYYHLHERIPGHLKYPLHVLLIKHGKMCSNCSAKGFATVKEELPSSDESGGEDAKGLAAKNDEAVKKDVKDEEGAPVDRSKGRPCPLKAAGLLGRKGKALGPKFEAESKADSKAPARPKVEAQAKPSSGRRSMTTAVHSEVKMEPPPPPPPTKEARSSLPYVSAKEALEKAQAMSSADLLKCLQQLRSTRSKNPLSEPLKKKRYTLELSHGNALSAEQRKRVFRIFEDNMKSMYRNSTLGWKPTEKKKELFDAASRFLIVRPPDVGAEIAGYAMWRFDRELCSKDDPLHPRVRQWMEASEDELLEIAYLYEIQVAKDHQKAGLGREMMHLLYDLTAHLGLNKVMLTVFNANKAAKKFYSSEGYNVDLISPSVDDQMKDRVDYEILSKPTTTAT